MIRTILIALVLATFSAPAGAGFKMFGPNGYIEGKPARKEKPISAEEQERRNAEAERQRLERELAWAEEQRRIAEHNARMNAIYRSQKPSPPACNTYQPRNKYNDGPRPGGHRRHLWREQTGFNTPAERTRYKNEIRRLNRELKKERAKPNPAGDHPTKTRKSLGIKL